MAALVMQPLTANDRMAPASTADAKALIAPNDRLSSLERLQIYNQQYWWRLLGAFAEDFPGLRAVLGNRKFDRLAAAYLHAIGSQSWNLRDLGQYLAAYLPDHPGLTHPFTDLSLEMVQVEWAKIEAFDGDSKPVLDPNTLTQRAPSKIKLTLQPYLTLLELCYPIDLLLRKLKQREIETDSMSNAVSNRAPRRGLRLRASASKTPIHLAIHRVDNSVYYKRLEPESFLLLKSLANGVSLDVACELAFANSPTLPNDAAAKIQSWFGTWIRLGWLCA